MTYEEAKYITLWKLALTYGFGGAAPDVTWHHSFHAITTDVKRRRRIWLVRLGGPGNCSFCWAAANCESCPIDDLCCEWMKLAVGDRRYRKQTLRRIFNALLALPMPTGKGGT